MREHVKTTAEAKFGKPWKHHGTSAKQRNRLSRTQQLWYAGHEEYLPEWDQDEDLGQGFWEWYDEREEEELAQQDWEDLVYGCWEEVRRKNRGDGDGEAVLQAEAPVEAVVKPAA